MKKEININERLKELRDEEADKKEEQIEEKRKWKAMPYHQTATRIDELTEQYRGVNSNILLRIRVVFPTTDFNNKFLWNTFIEIEYEGKMIMQEYASSEYAESIFKSKEWNAEECGNISFFSKMIAKKEMEARFKILTIRNMDSVNNKDVSEILGRFMDDNRIESAQKGFESLIRRYKRNQEWSDKREIYDKEIIEKLKRENEQLTTELQKHKNTTIVLAQFAKLINETIK
jgi:hypothetical protein